MMKRLLLVFACFLPPAPVSIAQTATEFIANNNGLPLRNLLIEVRQVQSGRTQQSGLETNGATRINNEGQLSVQGQLRAHQQHSQQGGGAVQQVMVLNGRNATIALRASQPLRLLQSFIRNGRVIVTQGVVFLEAGTGFMATPRWDGTEQVELSIAAQQSLPNAIGMAGATSTASTQSVLVVPLGQWTTIAQSELSGNNDTQGLGGNSASATQSSTEVQVRITVR
jgi:hypothetical protein